MLEPEYVVQASVSEDQVSPSVDPAIPLQGSIVPEEFETRKVALKEDYIAMFKELGTWTNQKKTSTLDLEEVYAHFLPRFKTRAYIDLCLAEIETKGKYMIDRVNSKIHGL